MSPGAALEKSPKAPPPWVSQLLGLLGHGPLLFSLWGALCPELAGPPAHICLLASPCPSPPASGILPCVGISSAAAPSRACDLWCTGHTLVCPAWGLDSVTSGVQATPVSVLPEVCTYDGTSGSSPSVSRTPPFVYPRDGTLCVWIAWLRSVLCHPDVGWFLLYLFLFGETLSCK